MNKLQNFFRRLEKFVEKKIKETNYRFLVRRELVKLFRANETRQRKKLAAAMGPLSANESEILAALSELGYYRFPEGQMDVERLQALLALEQTRPMSAHYGQAKSKKSFFSMFATPDDNRIDSVPVMFCSQEKIVKIAASYLGMLPRLNTLELVTSVFVASEDWVKSQRWHIDWDDVRMLKVFTYLSNVKTDADGPFTLLPANLSGLARLPILPVHKTDEAMEKVAAEKNAVKIFGPRGTTFLVDTHRCYHRGSRIGEGHYRRALIGSFTTHLTTLKYSPRINDPSSLLFKGKPGHLFC